MTATFVKSRKHVKATGATLRTPELMEQDREKSDRLKGTPGRSPAAFELALTQRLGMTEEASREAGSAEKMAIRFRPMMKLEAYQAAKERAAAKPIIISTFETAQKVQRGSVAPKLGTTFEGVDQITAGGLLPPDPHGAVGRTQYVQATNTHLDVYEKASPNNRVKSIALDAFMGYFDQVLFDPRVIYDSVWQRWIIIAEAFPESETIQRQFLAISTSEDATGSFYIYGLDVNYTGRVDFFWDYPQLGMDQNSIIITANIFPEFTASMFAVAKSRIYNGLGFTVPIFTGLIPTLAPPIVLDQNAKSFLIAAQPQGDILKLYTLENSSSPDDITLSEPTDVGVTFYSVPPQAQQPGEGSFIDTLDSRFANASTQNGHSLWQAHTVALDQFSAPKYYEIDTSDASLIQSGFFYASETSYDFNVSIAANANNDAFVTYSSTDPEAGIFTQVRCSARLNADPESVIEAGFAAFTSHVPYADGFRWGDYSSVAIDPEDIAQAWFVNEKANEGSVWGTGIGTIRLESH